MTSGTTSDRWAPVRTAGRLSAHLQTYLTVLLIVVAAGLVGTTTFPLEPGQVVLLPLLYAVILSLALGYGVLRSVIEPLRPVVDEGVSRTTSPLPVVALIPLGVEYGALVIPSFYGLVVAGPASVPQEFENLGTILVALPLALLLGLEHESIDAAVGIAREPTLDVITDRYGIESSEDRGVPGTCMTGTILGTVFFGLFGGFTPVTGLHPLALSMTCGMGSASMMTACFMSLAAAVGDAGVAEDQILGFAATSSLLTGITGLCMVVLVGLPVITRLYAILAPVLDRDTTTADGGE